MSIIRALIIDDEPTAREIIKIHCLKIGGIKIVASCKNALEALGVLQKQTVDLIFLDVNMPEMSGINFAKSLAQPIKIIFTTAYREYAIDGFDLQAVDYLLKPISFERFVQAVQKFRKDTINPAISESNKVLHLRADRKTIRVKFEDILYFESLGDYLKTHTKTSVITSRETISNIEKEVIDSAFIRIHRSFIVSLDVIESYNNEVVEINGNEIPISRSYKQAFLKKMGSFSA